MNRPMLLPVILCGGSGTRLWPLSRETYPKQFLALTGVHTLLQQTVLRLGGLSHDVPQAPTPVLVCNEEHRFVVASQLQEVGIEHACILLEPAARNTAPALTLAALQAQSRGEDPVILAMPADHVVGDVPAFHDAVQHAYAAACQGHVVTFGVVPSYPETGYGYIQCHAEAAVPIASVLSIRSEPLLRQIERFTEKPPLELAQQYLQSGAHFWNSGMFMLKARTWLQALGYCRADILGACTSAMQAARQDLDFVRPDAAQFAGCPSDSIDYAVMERLPACSELGVPLSMVPLQAGWSDVGAWDALWSQIQRDPQGNAMVGSAVVQQGCTDSLLLSSSRFVAGVGLDNVVVVETPDAVLVADKRRTQDVKQVVAQLAQAGHALARTHRKVHRPWGWYDCLDKGERFQVKRIVVNPGASLSLQMHHHRAEHWVVVQGVAEVTNGEDTYLLEANQSTYIPVGRVHRLSNPSDVPLEIIEVQSGEYLGEDDIVRFDDRYGRIV